MTTVRSEETATENAASYRLAYWQDALRMTAAHPFGVGAGNYEDAIRTQKNASVYYAADPHSAPLRIVSETGVGSLLFFLFLVFFD